MNVIGSLRVFKHIKHQCESGFHRISKDLHVEYISLYFALNCLCFCCVRQGLDQLENPITMELHWHPNPVSDVVFSHDGKI